eukprot:12425753-Karenia_brevis.AAC.1
MGFTLGSRLNTDSSSAIGIASRRGAAGVRHIETQTLWIQHKVSSKQILVRKRAGSTNPADLGTKALDWITIAKLLGLVSVAVR